MSVSFGVSVLELLSVSLLSVGVTVNVGVGVSVFVNVGVDELECCGRRHCWRYC